METVAYCVRCQPAPSKCCSKPTHVVEGDGPQHGREGAHVGDVRLCRSVREAHARRQRGLRRTERASCASGAACGMALAVARDGRSAEAQ
jgi:hypothetical protein